MQRTGSTGYRSTAPNSHCQRVGAHVHTLDLGETPRHGSEESDFTEVALGLARQACRLEEAAEAGPKQAEADLLAAGFGVKAVLRQRCAVS